MKPVGKPDAGNPHVRFDERGGETGLCDSAGTAPLLDSTGHGPQAPYSCRHARPSPERRHSCRPSVQDRDGAREFLRQARRRFPFIAVIFADAGYQGAKMKRRVAATGTWKLSIVKRNGSASLRRLAKALDRDRLYNVASLGFEWSSIVERGGWRRRPLLLASNGDRAASQFVAGESKSSQGLMRHRRPALGPTADGGAHGPAHGSPSAGAGIVRSDKIEPSAPDRGLRPSCAGRSAPEPAVELR